MAAMQSNRHPRPPLPVAEYGAIIRWSALLGGGEETIGPFRSHRDRDRAVAALRAPYPGDHWPSVTLTRVELPDAAI